MFSLFFGFLIGCTAADQPGADAEETAVVEESPITWDECSYRIGEHICNVTGPDINMEYQELYNYYGRPIVIQLAAEWCAPCHVAGLQAEATMSQWVAEDLLWITILLENNEREQPNAQDLAEWSIEMGTTNSLLWAGSRDWIDPAGDNGFPLTSWPTFVLVTSDMVVYHGFSGWSEDYLDQKIAEMLFNGG